MFEASAADRLLLVEGSSDYYLIEKLRERDPSLPSFRITPRDGIDLLIRSISVQAKESSLEALGIIVDANDHPRRRWHAISNQLGLVGASPPAEPEPAGTVVEMQRASENPLKIGVWLMPDNQSSGELEDFLAKLVPTSDDPVWTLAVKFISSIPEQYRRFPPQKSTRAVLYAWLATRSKPRQIGTALEAGDLDIEHSLAQSLIRWLKRTFQ